MSQACARCTRPLPADSRFCPNCGYPVDAPTPLDVERQARAFAAAPTALADKARAATFAGERKPVTAVFADIVGSTSILETLDPETWTAIVNDALEAISRAVYRYEGTVARLMGDGLLAFFGAPVAHENDPELAVRAGLDAISEVEEVARSVSAREDIDLRIRVGVNSGPVVVGAVGSELMYEYTAIGDAVNVAARLQAAARPGTVLISDITHRLVAHRFETLDIGLLELKGRSEPVRAFEVIGLRRVPLSPRGIPGLTSPMVGRDSELAAVEECLASLRDGRRRAVLVVGDPGIGKSRLLGELRTRAAHDGETAWIESRCLSYGRTLPYHLLLDVLRAMLGLPEQAEADVAAIALRTRLASLLGVGWEEAYAPLAHLFSLPAAADELEVIDRMEPRARHARYLAAARRVATATTGRSPLALICEDVHWVDPSSADALRELLPSLERTLLVCTARPDHDTPGWSLLERIRDALGPDCLDVPLAPLTTADSRALVESLLEIESLPPRARNLVLDKAEGNPFFLEEILRMLIDRGVIERRGERWVAAERALQVDLPDSIHGLLLGRIDRLPDHAKHAARVASVVGRRFSPSLLADLLDGEVVAALDSLVDAGVITEAPVEADEPHAQFRHVLLQEAAYDSILRRDRSTLHLQVGETLERRYPDRRSELAPVLAHHFEHGGDETRALAYLVEAGEHALARFAVHEARELLDRAAVHLADAENGEALRQRVQVELARVRAGLTFIPYDEEIAQLEALLPLAERLGDPRLVAETHLLIAQQRIDHGEAPRSSDSLLASLQAVMDIAETLDDAGLRAVPRYLLEGEARFAVGDYRAAIEAFSEVVPVLDAAGNHTMASVGAGGAAVAAARLGRFDEADAWLARQQELTERSGDPNARLDQAIHQGMVAAERGELERGIALAREGTDAARELDNKACEVVGALVIGQQAFRAGMADQALEAFERSSEVAHYCGAMNVENLARAWLATVHSERTGVGEAVVSLGNALEHARASGDRGAEGQIHQLRAMVGMQAPEPDWDLVRADFEAALAVYRELGTRPQEARTLRQYGLALQVAGDTDRSIDTMLAADALFAELGLTDETVGAS
jgi:class 3 adenylate cyclase/tetratricopeptide (TPR) repeat protein